MVIRRKKRICHKMSSERGDSIAEVLIALLISSLALVMLASMITSAANMIMKSKDTMTSYYSESTSLDYPNKNNGSITVTIGDEKKDISIKYYKTEKSFTNPPIVSFRAG